MERMAFQLLLMNFFCLVYVFVVQLSDTFLLVPLCCLLLILVFHCCKFRNVDPICNFWVVLLRKLLRLELLLSILNTIECEFSILIGNHLSLRFIIVLLLKLFSLIFGVSCYLRLIVLYLICL